ncbi:MAG: hypothetical protein CVU24_13090 [Betaproteobacteria bacterium HGW-Betaproteobacteria-18]|jgi:hypothetical protein|nr:MAG: hypothetical protein CVU24_13090 [Betaproteobacteria bacterium HGW-Betaproteobacteria-18]
MALSPELVAILVCPQCKGTLTLEPAETGFICPACRLRYPVREGIPVMLVDEAEKI